MCPIVSRKRRIQERYISAHMDKPTNRRNTSTKKETFLAERPSVAMDDSIYSMEYIPYMAIGTPWGHYRKRSW